MRAKILASIVVAELVVTGLVLSLAKLKWVGPSTHQISLGGNTYARVIAVGDWLNPGSMWAPDGGQVDRRTHEAVTEFFSRANGGVSTSLPRLPVHNPIWILCECEGNFQDLSLALTYTPYQIQSPYFPIEAAYDVIPFQRKQEDNEIFCNVEDFRLLRVYSFPDGKKTYDMRIDLPDPLGCKEIDKFRLGTKKLNDGTPVSIAKWTHKETGAPKWAKGYATDYRVTAVVKKPFLRTYFTIESPDIWSPAKPVATDLHNGRVKLVFRVACWGFPNAHTLFTIKAGQLRIGVIKDIHLQPK